MAIRFLRTLARTRWITQQRIGRCWGAALACSCWMLLVLLLIFPAPDAALAQGELACLKEPAVIRLDGHVVIELHQRPAAANLPDYIDYAQKRLLAIAKDVQLHPDALKVQEQPSYSVLGFEGRQDVFQRVMAIDSGMAACADTSRQSLAQTYRRQIAAAVEEYRAANTLSAWFRGTALAGLVLGAYLFWLKLQRRTNTWLAAQIQTRYGDIGSAPSRSGQHQPLVNRFLLLNFLREFINLALLASVSYVLIPLLLAFFPPTRWVALGLHQHLRNQIGLISSSLVASIPNVLAVLLLLILGVVLIRLTNAWFRQIRLGRIRIPGFYAEWALPTARLVAFLIAVITLSTVFPLIPGSDNKVFQGAGIAIGALAAIGSGVVTSNLLSGLMLFYTRAFRTGDRVEINGVVGVVQERSLVTTRLQTPRNELVSIPNTTVLSSSVVNFSFARREVRQPVALSATISIGYNVPWRQVHALMLEAAREVSGISGEVAPFVLQTSLNDFHISYEVTAYLRDARTYRQTLSELLAALQDRFAEAGVEIMSPGQLQVRRG